MDGQAGLLAGSTAERAEPLEGLAGLGELKDKAFPASALGDCPGEVALCMLPEQGIPGTSPYMAAVIWVTI